MDKLRLEIRAMDEVSDRDWRSPSAGVDYYTRNGEPWVTLGPSRFLAGFLGEYSGSGEAAVTSLAGERNQELAGEGCFGEGAVKSP